MCPTPPTPPLSSMDSHSDFVLNISSYLANKTNLNIKVSKGTNQNAIMSNISEDDLTKLPFLTNTNISNKILNIEGMNVGITALDGSLQNISIPGFSQTMIQLFHNSDTTTFLFGNKTHIPFKSPFKKRLNGPPQVFNSFKNYKKTFKNEKHFG